MHVRLPLFFTLAAVVGAGLLAPIDLPGGGRTAAAQSAWAYANAHQRARDRRAANSHTLVTGRPTDQHNRAAARWHGERPVVRSKPYR